ncbi:MAG: EVE domain-containing protein [Bryobacterales bacterium]|nr:EVE domain-containing protein [Bryobacterales bacterium]
MAGARNYWLIKSEPSAYSWDDLVRDGWTYWDGIRNYEARNNLRRMSTGDQVLFYHSVKGVAVVGVAEVIREHYQDPTTADERWCAVDVKPVRPLGRQVRLKEIKKNPRLADMVLVRRSRLSVCPVTPHEFKEVLAMGDKASG